MDLISESEVSHRLVDRAIGELRPDQHDSSAGPGLSQEVTDMMRDELFGLLAHLHFHEITGRELDYAAERIAEMRRWVTCLERQTVDLPR